VLGAAGVSADVRLGLGGGAAAAAAAAAAALQKRRRHGYFTQVSACLLRGSRCHAGLPV
jgi:hypothetical protein